MIQRSWETHWNDLSEFFKCPEKIRRVIYTTNLIESLNSSLRKVTKNRAAFPDDEAIIKLCIWQSVKPLKNGLCQLEIGD